VPKAKAPVTRRFVFLSWGGEVGRAGAGARAGREGFQGYEYDRYLYLCLYSTLLRTCEEYDALAFLFQWAEPPPACASASAGLLPARTGCCKGVCEIQRTACFVSGAERVTSAVLASLVAGWGCNRHGRVQVPSTSAPCTGHSHRLRGMLL
jgi:hypothetical protein